MMGLEGEKHHSITLFTWALKVQNKTAPALAN